MKTSICIIKDGLSEKEKTTLLFASEELQKYLGMITDGDINICDSDVLCQNGINLGVGLNPSVEEVENPELDDAVFIDVENLHGTITGSNARSVLISVYRFLKELGFCFLRPGPGGEKIPDQLEKKKVFVDEKATYRHRGICIEGSLFKEYLPMIIDWLPKVEMNCYFMQFKTPEYFFNRWYENYEDDGRPTKEEINEINLLTEAEIEKRSLIFHSVGHGWTSEPLGIETIGWDTADEDAVPPEYKDMLAMINGKRSLFKNIPLDTNLCYSNQAARNIITDCVVKYCKEHPNVGYVHFWIADGSNNNCECDECTKKRTSDHYVTMLNELDEKLTNEGIKTRIVFLIYVDLLWKPICERIKNPERFTLMFAPITRSFSKVMDVESRGLMTEYKVNKLEFPQEVQDNIEYLRDWQTIFDGDSFDYDYYYWHDFLVEYSFQKLSQVVYKDIQNLSSLNLNGMVNPVSHRIILPTAFGMHIMAEALWNKNVSFDKVKEEVLYAEYGENYGVVMNYLEELSKYNCSEALRCEEHLVTKENFDKLKKGINIINEFKTKAESIMQTASDDRLKHNWKGIIFHANLQEKMFTIYLNIEDGYKDSLAELKKYALEHEKEFKYEFSAHTFNTWVGATLYYVSKSERVFDIRENDNNDNKKE